MKYIKDMYPEYEGKWNFYFTSILDEDCTVRTDLNLIEIAPIKEFPILVTIRVIMNKFHRDGTPSSDIKLLTNLEQEIHKALYKNYQCIKTGIITFPEEIHHIYYFKNKENITEILDPIIEKYHREYTAALAIDPDWETYTDVLFPTQIELQEIYNRNALEHLKEHLDDGSGKRPVEFYAFFKTKEAQAKYEKSLRQIVNGDFKVVRRMETLKSKDFPYEIKFKRDMSLTLTNMDNINVVTGILIDLSKDKESFFDGWETQIAKPDEKRKRNQKKYFIKDIKKLLENWQEPEGCIASDRILVDGMKVGYCYRQKPDSEADSGWRFFAGDEDIQYAKDSSNFGLYELNTICNYDQDIIPILNSEYNVAYEKDKQGKFAQVKFEI